MDAQLTQNEAAAVREAISVLAADAQTQPDDNVIDCYQVGHDTFVTLGELMAAYIERPRWMNQSQLPGEIDRTEMAVHGFVELSSSDQVVVYGRGRCAVIVSKMFGHTSYHPNLFPANELGQLVDDVA